MASKAVQEEVKEAVKRQNVQPRLPAHSDYFCSFVDLQVKQGCKSTRLLQPVHTVLISGHK
ncbi:hypothetical protein GQ55_5G254700 [Panicum hallii var. hallii]|uniref:Uncharacterized protein n=1 Tax=Panicum hallii var. hallii TaxID=1504633 RepID=A0A2T7DK56_9POAL|nr:hypothetical protein GQ55_5G254700 [Panicum hallii var. hallii]